MTEYYVRTGGADTNSGSSVPLTPEQSGANMSTNGTTTVTSATGNFSAADVGKSINISNIIYKVVSVISPTQLNVSSSIAALTNRPWAIGGAVATPNKMTNSNILVSGDKIHIGAGTYRGVVSLAGTSMMPDSVLVRGDIDGSATGDAGEVRLTTWTSDTTWSNSIVLSPGASRSGWRFENINFFTGYSGSSIIWGNSSNLYFYNCVFQNSYNLISHNSTVAVPLNITYDKCRFFTLGGYAMTITLPTHAAADYDANILIKNCVFVVSSYALYLNATGALAFKGGGVRFINNTALTGSYSIHASNANLSTVYPTIVENCFIYSGAQAFFATAAGQIVENYNVVSGGMVNPRTLVTTGANSTNGSPYFNWGQETIWSAFPKPFGSPMRGHPAIGWGASANSPATDYVGVTRPGPAKDTPGALLYSTGFQPESTTTHTGANAMSITGPGYQDFYFPLQDGENTISVYLRYDGGYSGVLPEFSVTSTALAVSAKTNATVAALNGWEQVSLTVTPAKSGTAVVRITSLDSSGTGKVYLDTFGISYGG